MKDILLKLTLAASVVLGVFTVVHVSSAALLGPGHNGGGGVLVPSMFILSGSTLLPGDSTWGIQVPSLAPGCLETDVLGNIVTTNQNCASGNASTSPGGATTDVQFAAFGAFGGSANFTFATTTNTLTVSNKLVVPNASSTVGATLGTLWATTANVTGISTLATLLATTFNVSGVSTLATTTVSNFTASATSTLAITSATALSATSFTLNGTTVLPILSTTTASLGGGLLTAGTCSSVNATSSAIGANMAVVATPNIYPGDGSTWYGYVSSTTAGVVTVKVCALVTVTPTASTYNVRVIQ